MSGMNNMNYRRNDESLCEKSMQVVINIIKLSSFQAPSLFSGKNITAKRVVSDTAATRSPSPSATAADAPGLANKKNLKSQKVQKPGRVSYLVEPADEEKDNNKTAVYVIHNSNHEQEKKNVDGMASDYIKSVYEKIHLKSNNDNMSRFSAFMKKSRPRALLA